MTEAAGPAELQFVILAGGLGTRMRGVIGEVPKALAPVAGAPFIHHQLALLASQGVRRIVLCTGYGGGRIRDFVGDGSRWGLEVSYVDEGEELRGTGGALRTALEVEALDESFAVLYGDSYLPVDLGPIVRAFGESGLPALMTVVRNEDRWDASNAVLRQGRVVLYDKRPEARTPEMAWIDYGLSVLTRESIRELVPSSRVVDLADVYRELGAEGLLAGFEVGERFYEVGSVEGLADLEAYLRDRG